MSLGPAKGALIACCVKSNMPVMTPKSDFNAKLESVRGMMMRFLNLPVQVAFE
jgi:hypothetical protein